MVPDSPRTRASQPSLPVPSGSTAVPERQMRPRSLFSRGRGFLHSNDGRSPRLVRDSLSGGFGKQPFGACPDEPTRTTATQRGAARDSARCPGDGGQCPMVRLGGAGAHVQDADRQGGERAALSPRRGTPRGRRARPPLELRRRRRALPPGLRGAAHPAGAPVRSGAGGAYLHRRAAAAPDHGGLRDHAAAPAAALPVGGRPRRRQDHHGRPA